MKLSWFNTSMGTHKQYQAYMIWTIWINTRYKKERVKRQWIKCKHRDMFRGSNHCSTSPPSHRRIFTNASTQDFSHKNLQWWFGKYKL